MAFDLMHRLLNSPFQGGIESLYHGP